MHRERLQGWLLIFSSVGMVAALNYPIWLPSHYLIAAVWFNAVHALAALGMWPAPPAGAERVGNLIGACIAGMYIGLFVTAGIVLGSHGEAWFALAIHFGAWIAWICFLGSEPENGG